MILLYHIVFQFIFFLILVIIVLNRDTISQRFVYKQKRAQIIRQNSCAEYVFTFFSHFSNQTNFLFIISAAPIWNWAKKFIKISINFTFSAFIAFLVNSIKPKFANLRFSNLLNWYVVNWLASFYSIIFHQLVHIKYGNNQTTIYIVV